MLATFTAFALAPSALTAQQVSSTPEPGHRVALIDVKYIIKNLPAIKAHASKVKAELKRDEAELQEKRDVLKRAVDKLKTLKVGTVEYDRQEEHVAELDSKLRLQSVHKHRELNEAESKLYYDSYQKLTAAVQAIAKHNKIDLVMRFDSEEMNAQQNDSVIRGVLKNVVYHDTAINMTSTVMRYLEKQATSP